MTQCVLPWRPHVWVCVYLSKVQLLLSSGLSLNLQDDKASNPSTSGTTSTQSPSETRARGWFSIARLLIKSSSAASHTRRFPPLLPAHLSIHRATHAHTQVNKRTLEIWNWTRAFICGIRICEAGRDGKVIKFGSPVVSLRIYFFRQRAVAAVCSNTRTQKKDILMMNDGQ